MENETETKAKAIKTEEYSDKIAKLTTRQLRGEITRQGKAASYTSPLGAAMTDILKIVLDNHTAGMVPYLR